MPQKEKHRSDLNPWTTSQCDHQRNVGWKNHETWLPEWLKRLTNDLSGGKKFNTHFSERNIVSISGSYWAVKVSWRGTQQIIDASVEKCRYVCVENEGTFFDDIIYANKNPKTKERNEQILEQFLQGELVTMDE